MKAYSATSLSCDQSNLQGIHACDLLIDVARMDIYFHIGEDKPAFCGAMALRCLSSEQQGHKSAPCLVVHIWRPIYIVIAH